MVTESACSRVAVFRRIIPNAHQSADDSAGRS